MEIRSRIFCVLLNSLFLSPKSVSAVRMYGDETDIRRFCAFLSIPFAGLLKKCRWLHFLFCLLAVLGLYLVGVGVTLSRRRRHTCFAYVSIPSTTRYLVGANIVRPRRNIKKLCVSRTFLHRKVRERKSYFSTKTH